MVSIATDVVLIFLPLNEGQRVVFLVGTVCVGVYCSKLLDNNGVLLMAIRMIGMLKFLIL